jgi:hypothetical protein
MRRAKILAAGVLLLALLGLAGGARAASPLELGFFDAVFTGPNGGAWLQRSAGAGADVVRIDIGWDAPNGTHRPVGFHAQDPGDPQYDFSRADQAIRDASADGLRIIASFSGAPAWAEGPGMPADASPGSWRPDPSALEDYGIALGRRYSGHFPDPQHPGHNLPRVGSFQVWNEPNLSKYLSPQWSGTRTAAPELYRRMLNAFYRGVKSVDPSALVVTAGTAPFGDPAPGGERIMPARFVRDLLCLRQTAIGFMGTRCKDPAHFDVLAHHPYSVGAPDTVALNADDVSIPDLGKLTRLLRAAERNGTALPRRRHPLWVTEVGYNTKPPNPQGVPIGEDARWLEQTLELLWQQGVGVITWNTIVDQPPDPSYSATSQSGVFFLNGRPKAPVLQAFRFPLVATRTGTGTVQVWGRAPAAGSVEIDRRVGSRWAAVRTLQTGAHATFLITVAARGGAGFRARIGDEQSLVWQLR